MLYKTLTKEKLECDIVAAFEVLYHRDRELVRWNTHERCLSARFVSYFMPIAEKSCDYEGLDVDPEYNRFSANGDPKCIDNDAVVPDVVIHQRGKPMYNICVMEFKKDETSNDVHNDYWKLESLTTDPKYNYRYGVHVVMGIQDLSLVWFEKGRKIERVRYNTFSWEKLSLVGERLQHRRRTCTLMITRCCNLDCGYCYETYKSPNSLYNMTFRTAKNLLKGEFEFVRESSEFDEIEIDFMGGEPFMNFSLIKKVVEWLEKSPPPVPYICFATTNGTLLKRHVKWLNKHRETLVLGGSFDGIGQAQSINRGTDEKKQVALDLLKELYPRQGLHMTVSRQSLPSLAEGVLKLQRQGFKVEVALAQGESWDSEDAKVYGEQLEKLGTAYLNTDTNLKPVNLLSRYLGGIDGHPAKHRQRKFCGTGTHMIAYDFDGKAYSCHLFTPVVLGEEAKCLDEIDYTDPRASEDERCVSCVLKRCCPTCAGFNFRYRGSIGERDMRWCLMMFTQFKVAAVFQQKYVAAMELPSLGDRVFLEAAVRADQTLCCHENPYC